MWLRRFEELGLEGLRDRSRRPLVSPKCNEERGCRQDRLPPPELPLRAAQDRHVLEALPRRPDQPLRGVADPQAPGHEPASLLPAVPAALLRWSLRAPVRETRTMRSRV